MATTPVGVELVADGTASFLSSLKTAEGGLGNFTTALGNVGSGMGGLATQSSTLSIALGTALGGALLDVGKSILSTGGQALKTVANFERSTQSITAMFAVEKMRGTEVAEITKGLTVLSGKEEKALRDKSLQYPVFEERVAKASEKLKALGKDTGTSTVEYKAAEAQLQININSMHDLGVEIDNLRGKAGQEFSSTKMVAAGDAITDVKEAFRQAQGPANEMIDSMTRLALKSPFKREDTIATLKMAKGFGMTLEESGALTEQLTKFATVTGRSGDHISRLAYAMGEMKSTGKVMMRQVRQMNLAGISVADMGEAFGVSANEMTEKIHKGTVSFDDFNTNLNKFIDDKYGVAFDQIANSFVGLNNAVEDIKELGLAAIFEGPLKLYKPLLEAFVQPFTSGTLLESIRGFSIGLTKSLIPMFEGLADQLTSVFKRFEVFASLIGGKGAIGIDKQETAIKDHQGTIDGLGKSMGVLTQNGITMSDSYAALSTSQAKLGAETNVVTTEFKKNSDSIKLMGETNDQLAKDNAKYGIELRKLGDAGKQNSVEFKALNAMVTENKVKIGENKKATNDLGLANDELSKEQKALEMQMGGVNRQMDASKLKGEDQSKMYKDLVAEMEAEAKVMGTNSDRYKAMAGQLKIMEDNTKQYGDEMGKLAVAGVVMGEMNDQLKKLNDDNKTMPWADAFLKANEDIMPVGSSLHTIFTSIFGILGKVLGLFKSTSGTVTGVAEPAFNAFNAVLANVAKAIKFVNDNFDIIVGVIKNVLSALVGLAAIGQVMSTIRTVITGVMLLLNPLNLLMAVIALFTVAWQKNWGDIQGVTKPAVDFVKAQLQAIKDWFLGIKVDTDFAKEQFDKFFTKVEDVFGKLATVVTGVATWAGLIPISLDEARLKDSFVKVEGYISKFDTKTIADKFTPEALGLYKAIDGLESLLLKFGYTPKIVDGIADSLREGAKKLGETFDLTEVSGKFGASNPQYKAVQDNIKGMFSVPFGSADAQSLIKAWAGHIKTAVKTMFGGDGFADSIGSAVAVAVEFVWLKIQDLLSVLALLKSGFIKTTEFIYKHHDAFLALIVTVGKVGTAFFILNKITGGFTGKALMGVLGKMGKAFWTYAYTSVKALVWQGAQKAALAVKEFATNTFSLASLQTFYATKLTMGWKDVWAKSAQYRTLDGYRSLDHVRLLFWQAQEWVSTQLANIRIQLADIAKAVSKSFWAAWGWIQAFAVDTVWGSIVLAGAAVRDAALVALDQLKALNKVFWNAYAWVELNLGNLIYGAMELAWQIGHDALVLVQQALTAATKVFWAAWAWIQSAVANLAGRAADLLAEVLFGASKSAMQWAESLVRSLAAAAGWLATAAANLVGTVADLAYEAVYWIAQKAVVLAGALYRATAAAIGWIATQAYNVFYWAAHFVYQAVQYAADLLYKLNHAILSALITAFKWLKEHAIELAGWLWKLALGAWAHLTEAIRAIAAWVVRIAKEIIGWIILNGITLGGILLQLAAGLMYMISMTAFLIGPWGIAIVLIILIIAAIVMNVDGLATAIMDLFMKIFGFLMDVIMTIVGSAITIIGTLYYLLKDQVVDFYNNSVKPALETVAEMFNALVTAVSFVIDILWGLWELFKLYILPIIEILVVGAISILVSYLMTLFTAVWGIIRLFWMLVKWIWSLISSFLEWSGIIDGVKWVFNELVKFGKGPIVAGFFKGLMGLIGGIVKAFGLIRDGINSVIEGFAKAERARLGTTLLSDLDARDPNYESKKNAILEGEQMKKYTVNFGGVDRGPDFDKEVAGASESRYTKQMEGGDLGDKPAEGGFLSGLFGTGKGKGIMDLMGGAAGAAPAGMDVGAMEGGAEPDFMSKLGMGGAGVGAGIPGASAPPGTGGRGAPMNRTQEQYGGDNAAEAAYSVSRNRVYKTGDTVEGRGTFVNNTWMQMGSNVTSSTSSKVGVAPPVRKLTVAEQALASKQNSSRLAAMAGSEG